MELLIQMSAKGGILILAVLLVRLILGERLPKKLNLLFWDIAVLRMLCPFFIPITVPTGAPLPYSGQILVRALESNAKNEAAFSMSALLCLLWICGAVGCGVAFFLSHLRCSRRYAASLPMTNAVIRIWRERHPLRRNYRLRYSDEITSALTYGLFRPVILLPKGAESLDSATLDFVLTHEFVHIRRCDVLRKWALALVLSLYWFHPLVWVLYLRYNREIELSCDEKVLELLGKSRRGSYARTLIRLEEQKSGLSPFYSSFSKNGTEERIVMMMKNKKISIFGTIAAIGLIAAAVTMTTFAAEAEGSAPAQPNAPAQTETAAEGELVQFDLNAPLELKIDEENDQKYTTINGKKYVLHYVSDSAAFPNGCLK